VVALFCGGVGDSMIPDDVATIPPFSEVSGDPMIFMVEDFALLRAYEMLAPSNEDRVPLSQYPEDSVIFVIGEAKKFGILRDLGPGD
jgi:hypothetical protein